MQQKQPGLNFLLSVVALAVACGGRDSGAKLSTDPGLIVPKPGVPFSLEIVAGAITQYTTAGTAVASSPVVRVVDLGGAPVRNVTVAFAVTSGGGTLSAIGV